MIIWAKTIPRSKSCEIYLKTCILVNLKVLNKNLTLVFLDFISKILSDLFENVYTSQFAVGDFESNIDILKFFLQNLNLGKLVLKLKYSSIYLKICTQANLKIIKTNMTAT